MRPEGGAREKENLELHTRIPLCIWLDSRAAFRGAEISLRFSPGSAGAVAGAIFRGLSEAGATHFCLIPANLEL
jgi:hypothetical protein